MKKILLFLFILTFPIFINWSIGQVDDIDSLTQQFIKFYASGDIENANGCLQILLKSENKLSKRYDLFVYQNLGVINTILGNYNEALIYYDRAESFISENADNSIFLGDIYVNKAIIYGYQKSYQMAIDYFEKAIRVLFLSEKSKHDFYSSLASAYLNLGIIYFEVKDYESALEFLIKSSEIKIRWNLSGLGLVYLNIAKTFEKTGDILQVEEFYLKSIISFKKDFGEKYFRLAEVYFEYGRYLNSNGRKDEAIEIHNKALSICLKNYGSKHSLVSYAYKLLGDDYIAKQEINRALDYYQKALISISNNFSNPDIYTNPSIDSSLFDIRLLDNLKSKARALEMLAGETTDQKLKLKNLNKSLETIDLALELIDRIRNNYITEENRIYLAENEKDTYLFAIRVAETLHSVTGDEAMILRMYSIAQKAKAAVLRDEITENDMLYSAAVPDSLREKQNRLSGNVAAYNKMVSEESRKSDPDSNKITLWKDALFTMNREAEKVREEINTGFPKYYELIGKTKPVPVNEIQRQMNKGETIIDYFLCSYNSGGLRKLYIFIISKNKLSMVERSLDTLFTKNANTILGANQVDRMQLASFGEYTSSLYYMYNNLIKPVERLIKGQKIIIIPDEEISRLPFDAFLTTNPDLEGADYSGLSYLIYNYTISYGYSSSMVFSGRNSCLTREKVISFSPDYSRSGFSGGSFETLTGADQEIESIFRLFKGEQFKGDSATEKNFLSAIRHPAIFHLAMHSIYDTINSKYSYLQFGTGKDSSTDGRLYNYEISLTRISSPMVVLSACNSGTGTLYHSEGLMSLARGFILAGASSVIKTSWEVNDNSSAEIINRFYFHLSGGRDKAEALRLAKLEYIKTQPPAFTSPYYWAAYEVLGDCSPVKVSRGTIGSIALLLIVIMVTGVLVYLRSRRIFPARSL